MTRTTDMHCFGHRHPKEFELMKNGSKNTFIATLCIQMLVFVYHLVIQMVNKHPHYQDGILLYCWLKFIFIFHLICIIFHLIFFNIMRDNLFFSEQLVFTNHGC